MDDVLCIYKNKKLNQRHSVCDGQITDLLYTPLVYQLRVGQIVWQKRIVLLFHDNFPYALWTIGGKKEKKRNPVAN